LLRDQRSTAGFSLTISSFPGTKINNQLLTAGFVSLNHPFYPICHAALFFLNGGFSWISPPLIFSLDKPAKMF